MQKLCEDFPGPNFVSPPEMEVSFEQALCPQETENKVRSQVSGVFTVGQGWLVKWIATDIEFIKARTNTFRAMGTQKTMANDPFITGNIYKNYLQ